MKLDIKDKIILACVIGANIFVCASMIYRGQWYSFAKYVSLASLLGICVLAKSEKGLEAILIGFGCYSVIEGLLSGTIITGLLSYFMFMGFALIVGYGFAQNKLQFSKESKQ